MTSAEDRARILDKVRKLLALAKSTNEHEAAAAAGQAFKIMEAHRLSEADLGEGIDVEPATVQHEPLYKSKRRMIWRSALAKVIADANGCAMWNQYERRWMDDKIVGVSIRIAGRKSDVEMVRYLFAYLLAETERLQPYSDRGMANSWRLGFVAGVKQQIQKAQSDARAASTTAAIVLVDKRKADADASIAATGMKLIKARGSRPSNLGAMEKGAEAGRNIHLGKSLSQDGKAAPALPKGIRI